MILPGSRQLPHVFCHQHKMNGDLIVSRGFCISALRWLVFTARYELAHRSHCRREVPSRREYEVEAAAYVPHRLGGRCRG